MLKSVVVKPWYERQKELFIAFNKQDVEWLMDNYQGQLYVSDLAIKTFGIQQKIMARKPLITTDQVNKLSHSKVLEIANKGYTIIFYDLKTLSFKYLGIVTQGKMLQLICTPQELGLNVVNNVKISSFTMYAGTFNTPYRFVVVLQEDGAIELSDIDDIAIKTGCVFHVIHVDSNVSVVGLGQTSTCIAKDFRSILFV